MVAVCHCNIQPHPTDQEPRLLILIGTLSAKLRLLGTTLHSLCSGVMFTSRHFLYACLQATITNYLNMIDPFTAIHYKGHKHRSSLKFMFCLA